MQGDGKNIKPICYGPFKIIKQVGNNAFQLDLPSYMKMYSIVNVENLCLSEPHLIDDQGSDVQLPLLKISRQNFWMRSKKIQLLTGGQEHLRGAVLTTFELDSKALNQARKSGWRLER